MRATKKGEYVWLVSAFPKDKRKGRVSLGLISSKSKAGAVAKARREHGHKYMKYHAS
jgi:hypothetical protein